MAIVILTMTTYDYDLDYDSYEGEENDQDAIDNEYYWASYEEEQTKIAEQTQMFISRSAAFRHARPAKDKDKARWAKKQYAHKKMQVRGNDLNDPYSSWKREHAARYPKFAIEFQHSRFPLHTIEND